MAFASGPQAKVFASRPEVVVRTNNVERSLPRVAFALARRTVRRNAAETLT